MQWAGNPIIEKYNNTPKSVRPDGLKQQRPSKDKGKRFGIKEILTVAT